MIPEVGSTMIGSYTTGAPTGSHFMPGTLSVVTTVTSPPSSSGTGVITPVLLS